MKKNKVEIRAQKVDWVDESEFIRCDCFGHVLEVRREMELVDDKVTHQNFEICVWERYGERNMPLTIRERIRWCWWVLRKGTPWSDAVTISNEKAKSLANFILKHVNKKHKTTKK